MKDNKQFSRSIVKIPERPDRTTDANRTQSTSQVQFQKYTNKTAPLLPLEQQRTTFVNISLGIKVNPKNIHFCFQPFHI